MPSSARYVASGVTRNRYIEKENANAFKLTEMPDHVPMHPHVMHSAELGWSNNRHNAELQG